MECDVVVCSNGSHYELGKMELKRLKFITNETVRIGGGYIYNNAKGCDGGRLYFDGNNIAV
jgi:NAD+ synthase (glutamine-hydrolysing)